jgi:8-oxo-dGTP pyrophosphatase MutT (NUDIX family)
MEMRVAKLYGIGTSVYVQKDSDILILKRSGGAAKGAWYIPGGGLEEGESTEECARRELKEETGLQTKAAFHLVAVTPMFAYDHDMFMVAYACDYEAGDVELSDEHEGYRWLPAVEYREKYFSDKSIKIAEQRSSGAGEMAQSVRVEIDAYIKWLDL